MTLLEVLLSMTLLSAMAILLAGTVRSATSTLPDAAAPLAWQTAAEATVREIGRVLESRDRVTRLDRVILIDSESLTVVRADRTDVAVEFEDGRLTRIVDGQTRLLIGELSGVSWAFDPDSELLRIDLMHATGTSTSRTWSLAP